MPKQSTPSTLELVRGGDVLGTIDVKPGGADFPWMSGVFHPSSKYEEVRGLFERELQLLRANTEDDAAQWDDWEAVHEELHGPGLHLRGAGSHIEDEILIHIDGAEAWWRGE